MRRSDQAMSSDSKIVRFAYGPVGAHKKTLARQAQGVVKEGEDMGEEPERTLVDELALELVDELQVEVVLEGQGLLTHHGLHGHHVLAQGVVRVLQSQAGQARSDTLAKGLIG